MAANNTSPQRRRRDRASTQRAGTAKKPAQQRGRDYQTVLDNLVTETVALRPAERSRVLGFVGWLVRCFRRLTGR